MPEPIDEFWEQEKAREIAERGKKADPTACGTCRERVAAGQQVKHDECAQRATLLEAPDHPGYEVITTMTEAEVAALPPRFHVPVFIESCEPKAWVCAVCWGDGWNSQWPCATAMQHGTQVFTPQHEAETAAKKQAARIAELETELAKYVGKEPTIAEEMAYLSRCLDAVYDLCDNAEKQAGRWEHPLPVPEWVEQVRAAAEGQCERLTYPPALPWATLMDDEDLAEFLDELAASAITHASSEPALAEVEATCGRWRLIAEAQHAHNTAPGPDAQGGGSRG